MTENPHKPYFPLVDTHCHLNMPPLGDDPVAVLARAVARGVTRVIIPAYDQASWGPIIALAGSDSVALPTIGPDGASGSQSPSPPSAHRKLVGQRNTFFALGVHPWAAAEIPPGEALALATRLARYHADHPASHPAPMVAIGEIGLDTKIDLTAPGLSLADQQRVLNAQLAAAVDLDLPVILHCRGAFEELLIAVRAHGGRLRGVLHAFSRSHEVAERFIAAGLHIGLGGAITRPGARKVRKAAAELPLEHLVLETDAPSIGLDGVPPEQTEPCHVAQVARALAELRGLPLDEVARRTTRNAERLFRLS